MMRLIRLGGTALLVAAALAVPVSAHAAAPSAMGLGDINTIFTGYVTQGPDRGMAIEGLLSLTGGAGTLTLGDGTAPAATASTAAAGTSLKVTLATGTLSGMAAGAGAAGFVGTFSGPKAGDQGFWRARTAMTVANYAITAHIAKGPHEGRTVLIGDLLGYVAADGTLFGTYTDNSKVGPGITPKIYAVHGSFVNNIMTASIVFTPKLAFGLVGRVGTFYGQDEVSGNIMGPSSRDTGTWAGLSNSAAP